jgi:hypothetical protein
VAHLKLEVEIPLNVSFEPDQQIKFRFTSPPPVVVILKERNRPDRNENFRRCNAVCIAIALPDIQPDIKVELDASLEDGIVKLSKLKPATIKSVDEILHHMRAVSRSTLIMFNWTHGLDGPPDPYGLAHAFYSTDGNSWFEYSQVRRVSFNVEEATHLIHGRKVEIEQVVSKVEAGVEEPLGRQLFRGAWGHIGTNPRSALVIGVAAAEVGLKRLIGTLIPAAEWLVQEVQAPPMRKILRDFLPTLPARATWADGSPIELPPKIISEVVKASELRNKIVHVGAMPPSRRELAIMLRAISDLLWICDIYLREHWAMKHVSLETKKNWPSKSNQS